MIFDHMVKYKGVYYPTGADVPVGENPVATKEETKKVETTSNNLKEIIENEKNIMKLKKLAKDNGVSFAKDISTVALKEKIIKDLSL